MRAILYRFAVRAPRPARLRGLARVQMGACADGRKCSSARVEMGASAVRRMRDSERGHRKYVRLSAMILRPPMIIFCFLFPPKGFFLLYSRVKVENSPCTQSLLMHEYHAFKYL